MGWLSDIFGEDYGANYAIGISDPENQEPLVYRAHAEGRGGDIVPQSDLPEDAQLQDWDARVQSADHMISQQIREPLNTLARVSQPYSHEMGGSNPIDMIDLENPGFEDVQIVNSGLWDVANRITSERMLPDGQIDETHKQETMEAIERALEQMNEIIESPEYSDLNAVEQQMREMGFEYTDIQNTVTPSEAANTMNPNLPQPTTFDFQ